MAVAAAALVLAGLLGTGTHTVQRGETLSAIAERYGTTVRALAAENGIADPNRVRAGIELRVPGSTAGGGAGAGTYRVRPGDTLGHIAAAHGTTVAAVARANGIADPNLIRVGEVLDVGSASGGGAAASDAGSYVVRAGDTVSSIARRFNVPAQELVDANGLVGDRIYVGQRLAFGPAPTGLPASIACPVPGARFMNDWGFPRSGGRFHAGNDLFAPRGTPVGAPAAGTVTQLVGSIGGNQVKLTADDGTVYVGTHLDRFGASGRVESGQVIGYVGDTGNAAGGPPHLHFEIRPAGGASVNPYPLLVAAC